jgi:adenylate cyclase, class 2
MFFFLCDLCAFSVPSVVKRRTVLSHTPAQMATRRPTHRETEIKLRITDLAGLIRKISSLRADCGGRVLERNALFDTPDADLRRRGRLLRIRIEIPAPSKLIPGGLARTVITSKSPAPASARSRYKEKLERELVVRSQRRWPASLLSLGFRPDFRYEKFRTTFRLPDPPAAAGLHLDLDETPVGVFLELEGQPGAIDRIARTLGFSPRDYIRSTYWDLNAGEFRRRGQVPGNMLFPA